MNTCVPKTAGTRHRPDPVQTRTKGWRAILRALSGIDQQFTRGDKILSYSVLIYSLGWGFLNSFLLILVWNLIIPWPNEDWVNWFFISQIVVVCVVGLISTVWFSIGGTIDLYKMFKLLKTKETNDLDDGRVIGHMNADDFAKEEARKSADPKL